MPNRNKKGIILFIVIGIVMVVSLLAVVMLRIISNQSRLIHHQVSRIRALYAAKAGMVLAFDKLRTGDWVRDATTKYYCINGKVDSLVVCNVPVINDAAIPYNVQITIYPQNILDIVNIDKVGIKTDYNYTP